MKSAAYIRDMRADTRVGTWIKMIEQSTAELQATLVAIFGMVPAKRIS